MTKHEDNMWHIAPRSLSHAELDAEVAYRIEKGDEDSARFAALYREVERRDH